MTRRGVWGETVMRRAQSWSRVGGPRARPAPAVGCLVRVRAPRAPAARAPVLHVCALTQTDDDAPDDAPDRGRGRRSAPWAAQGQAGKPKSREPSRPRGTSAASAPAPVLRSRPYARPPALYQSYNLVSPSRTDHISGPRSGPADPGTVPPPPTAHPQDLYHVYTTYMYIIRGRTVYT